MFKISCNEELEILSNSECLSEIVLHLFTDWMGEISKKEFRKSRVDKNSTRIPGGRSAT